MQDDVEHRGDVGVSPGPTTLAEGLTGDIRCIRCGYNQRGLSVRTTCPECGTPVLATVLAVVDPQASELQPLRRPVVTAAGLLATCVGTFLAALAVWLARLPELAAMVGWDTARFAWAGWVSAASLAVAGVGAFALIDLHTGVTSRQRATSALGVALFLPLVLIHAHIHLDLDSARGAGFFSSDGMSTERLAWRLAGGGIAAAIVLLLRPSTRLLAARSLVVRAGRVDRQSMYALAGALGVAAIGDVLGLMAHVLVGGAADLAQVASTFMIGVGSALFTLGLAGLVRDAVRLAPVILEPAIAPADILTTSREGSR